MYFGLEYLDRNSSSLGPRCLRKEKEEGVRADGVGWGG